MKKFYWLSILLIGLAMQIHSQNLFSEFGLTDEHVAMFSPYLHHTYGEVQFEAFKTNDQVRYYTELWVMSESFYVKRDAYPDGVTLDESIIDIRRFESYRLADQETTVPLEGFKDALILKSLSDVNQAKQKIYQYFH